MLAVATTSCDGVDADLFPLLHIFACISATSASCNGPRYCAQDKVTGCVYEVRMCKLPTQRSGDAAPRLPTDPAVTLWQQARIDALMSAGAAGDKVPWCVALPIDVYMQEQAATGDLYVACVDVFGGLSLGDLLRAGWRVIAESVFHDILTTVEEFSKVCSALPPHGNFTADALRQVLTVRDGLTEASRQSRWVVGDWALVMTPEGGNCADAATRDGGVNTPCQTRLTPREAEKTMADVEWVLHSTFSQLGVSADGVVLSSGQIEMTIDETVRRVRANVRQRVCLEVGEASRVVPDATAHAATPQDAVQPANALLARLRQMSTKEKLSYHQAAVRQEQLLVNKYRRRNAPLPPLPQPPNAGRPCAAPLDDLPPASRCLTSPVQVLKSILWQNQTVRTLGEALADGATHTMSDVACAVAALCHARPVVGVAAGNAATEQQDRAQREALRNVLLATAAAQHKSTTGVTRAMNARAAQRAATRGLAPHGGHPSDTSAAGRQLSLVQQQPPLASAATREAARVVSPYKQHAAVGTTERPPAAAAVVVPPATLLRQPSSGVPAGAGSTESRRPYVKPLPLGAVLQARERAGLGSTRSSPRAHTAGRVQAAATAAAGGGAASARNAPPLVRSGQPAAATARTPRSGRHAVAVETLVTSQRSRREAPRTPTFASHAAAPGASFARSPYAARNTRPRTPLRKAATHTVAAPSAPASAAPQLCPSSVTASEESSQAALPPQHVSLVRAERSASPSPKPPAGCVALEPPRERSTPIMYVPTTAAAVSAIERVAATTTRTRVAATESLHGKPTTTRINPARRRSPPRRPLTTMATGLLARHATSSAAPGAGMMVTPTPRHPTRARPAAGAAESPAVEVLVRRRPGKLHA